MAFPPTFLDELRRRLPIIDVIGRKVRLTRRGKQATGLCPFHNEKSPSFHAYDDDEPHYHCFGCGAHGDVITFVMQTEGLDFPSAVERLAGEAGLPVPRDTPEAREKAERATSLATVLEASAAFFQAKLKGSAGEAYFQRRGLTPATIAKFGLGFSPDSRTALKSHLQSKNIPEDLAVESGMLIKPEDGGPSYDRFRGRVMFPIGDSRGRIIGFGGRTLGEDKPKYLNSPETPLFKKGRALYNLDRAQKPARDKNEAIVVEGYMDVIALDQAGFPQAVAPLGTALTEDQMQALWRLAPEPILCFDGDAAGQAAAAKAAERVLPLLKPGFSLWFVDLGQDEAGAKQDPDSFLRQHGPQAMAKALGADEDDGGRRTPLSGILWRILNKNRLTDTPERRAAFRADIDRLGSLILDQAVREEYRKHFLALLQQMFGAVEGGNRLAPGQRRGPSQRGSGAQGAVQTVGGWSRPYAEWRFLPEFQKDWGGQAQRLGLTLLHKLPAESLFAAAINHPELLYRYIEELDSVEVPGAELRGFKRRLIGLAHDRPDLDAAQVWTALVEGGALPVLEDLVRRTHFVRFTDRKASAEEAEQGFLHVLAVLGERHLRQEWAEAGKALAEESSDRNLEKFQALQALVLESESRRRDLDPAGDWPSSGQR